MVGTDEELEGAGGGGGDFWGGLADFFSPIVGGVGRAIGNFDFGQGWGTPSYEDPNRRPTYRTYPAQTRGQVFTPPQYTVAPPQSYRYTSLKQIPQSYLVLGGLFAILILSGGRR